jgi:hypothetical protein
VVQSSRKSWRWVGGFFICLLALSAANVPSMAQSHGTEFLPVALPYRQANQDVLISDSDLLPGNVIQSGPVSFRLTLTNTELLELSVISGVLSFSDGSRTYNADLLDVPLLLPAGAATVATFQVQTVDPAFSPGVYNPHLSISGADSNSLPYAAEWDLAESVYIWPDEGGLSEIAGTLMPTEPDSYFHP